MQYKKVLKSGKVIFDLILLMVMIILFGQSVTLAGKVRLFPLIITGGVAGFLMFQLVLIFLKGERKSTEMALPVTNVPSVIPWKVPAAFGILLVMVGLVYAISLPVAVGVMGASLCMLYGERRWWVIILIGIVCWTLVYWVFHVLFGLHM